MICRAFVFVSVLILPTAFAASQGRNPAEPAKPGEPSRPLQIYVVDTEGGKAALWISPTGETLLIDSGNPGGRDTDRIMAVIQDAGVTKIDYLLTTHYHVDHVGGMQELVSRIPVGTFVDHGPTVEGPVNPNLREQVAGFQAWYADAYAKAKHLVVKPGDLVPITGLDVAHRDVRRPGTQDRVDRGRPAQSRLCGNAAERDFRRSREWPVGG